MKTLITLLLLLVVASVVQGQVTISGDITAHIDSLIDVIPGATPAGLYLQPSAATRDIWRGIIQDILAGDYASAHAAASNRGYRVVIFTDTETHPDKQYIMLERTPETSAYYWGTFVFDEFPVRDNLVIQCPHAAYDTNTGKEGWRVFTTAGARAYFVNSVHRCNGETASPCDGTTEACGTAQAYRYSDMPHVVYGTFQVTTEEMLDVYPELIFIQPHGFSKETGDPDIIMSNGTLYTPTLDYLPTLRNNLLAQDATLTFKIAHLDSWTRLAARDNVQGRLINNSTDPCGTYATSSTGHFIHLEQAYSKLRNTSSNWMKLANAVAATFPVTGATVTAHSGEWLNDDTWSTGLAPNEEEDVTILSGHIVTVAGNGSSCRSITFAAADAYLEMEDHCRLSIFGDFQVASASHNVFAQGWSWQDARLKFEGDYTQTLLGFGPGANGTTFRDVTVDKSGGVLTTAGNSMRFEIGNSLELASGYVTVAAGDTLALTGTLTLGSGTLSTSATGATLRLADGATIVRTYGGLTGIPEFGSSVNVEYNGSESSLTTGPELPAGATFLNNLTISSYRGIVLASDVTVNGTLTLADSGLITGAHTVTLASGASLNETAGYAVDGQVQTTRTLSLGVNEQFGGLGIELNAIGVAPGITTALRVTGSPQTLEHGQSIARYYDLTPETNGGLGATLVFHYLESELNGLTEDNLVLYSSDDDGATWVLAGGTADASGNSVTLNGVAILSRWTLGAEYTTCCVGMVGDANGSGEDEPSLGDISALIDALFIKASAEPIACMAEADVNRSGGVEPLYEDLSLGDISILIDYLFISGPDDYDGGWGLGQLAPCF